MKAGRGAAARAHAASRNSDVRRDPSEYSLHVAKTLEAENKAREAARESFSSVRDLPATRKITNGEVGEITIEELEELFSHLAIDDSHRVPWTTISVLIEAFLECPQVDVEALRQHVAVQPGGVVSARQIQRAFGVISIRKLYMQAYQDKVRWRDVTHADHHVEREFLVGGVVRRVQRDDAFGTLPMTVCYMIVFCILVVYHLQIWRRQELERGLEEWVKNQGSQLYGPYITQHVYSMSTFLTWLDESGLNGIVGSVKGVGTNSVRVRVGIANELVGDLQLKQQRGESYDERSVWLFRTEQGAAHLKRSPGDYLGASKAAVDYLLNPANNWVGADTKDLSLIFCTYSNQAELFALTEIYVPLDRFGFVVPIVKSTAVNVNAYPFGFVYFVDALYFIIISFTMYHECKDMCAGICLGFNVFLDYWGVWNMVDWCSISLGFLNIAVWICCCMSMQANVIQDLLGDNMRLDPNVAELELTNVEDLHSALRLTHSLFLTLHVLVALTTLVIVLRFFKGFEANPRLQAVTMTLKGVAADVFHFLVVFLAVFVCFSVVAHVLFGSDIPKFFTLASSFNTGITVLMGDFTWYTDLLASPLAMPSGMPRIWLDLWFVAYMFFVLLIMLNMLLGIVLERYSVVSAVLAKKCDQDSRTLLDQGVRFMQRKVRTRNFIPLYRIRQELENDADPAHRAKVVTSESLMKAFPDMKRKQANWIMALLYQELDRMDEAGDDDSELRSKRMERFVQSIAEELHIVSSSVVDLYSRLGQLQSALGDETTMI